MLWGLLFGEVDETWGWTWCQAMHGQVKTYPDKPSKNGNLKTGQPSRTQWQAMHEDMGLELKTNHPWAHAKWAKIFVDYPWDHPTIFQVRSCLMKRRNCGTPTAYDAIPTVHDA